VAVTVKENLLGTILYEGYLDLGTLNASNVITEYIDISKVGVFSAIVARVSIVALTILAKKTKDK